MHMDISLYAYTRHTHKYKVNMYGLYRGWHNNSSKKKKQRVRKEEGMGQ